jgi:hypothetical protein
VAIILDTVAALGFDWPTPEVLCAQALCESSLNPAAANPGDNKGASMGLFMFQERTWNWLMQEAAAPTMTNWHGIVFDSWAVGAMDPIQATRMAVLYHRLIRLNQARVWHIDPAQVYDVNVWIDYNWGEGEMPAHFPNGQPDIDDSESVVPSSAITYVQNIVGYADEFAAMIGGN